MNRPVRQRAVVDWALCQVRVRIGGRVFIGVDPGHGRIGARTWHPLILDGTVLDTAAEPSARG